MSQRRRILRAVSRKGDTAEVFVEGVIDSGSAAELREQLAQAKGAKELRVHFNSDGGLVTEGTAMYNALRAFPGKKIGIVDGIAASIASIVLMACDEIKVAKGGYIMIHAPHSKVAGNADDLRSVADELDKMRGELLDIYETRTGIERAKLEALVDAETYFTAEEAVEAGIADSIEGYEAKIELAAVARLNPDKVPAGLRAAAKGKAMSAKAKKMKALEEEKKALEEKMKALEESDEEDKPSDDDDDEEEKPSDDDDDDDKDKPSDDDDDKEEASACLELVRSITGEKSLAVASGKLAALISAGGKGAPQRAELVSAAIKAGKLLPAMKSWALKASEKTFATYIKSIGGAQALKLGKAHSAPARGGAETELSTGELTETEKAVARQMRIKPEDMLKSRGVTLRTSVLTQETE